MYTIMCISTCKRWCVCVHVRVCMPMCACACVCVPWCVCGHLAGVGSLLPPCESQRKNQVFMPVGKCLSTGSSHQAKIVIFTP